jgi:DNA repair protein RadA/Sms
MFLAKKAKTNKMRAERTTTSSDNCYILTETKTQNILSKLKLLQSEIVIIDSIQNIAHRTFTLNSRPEVFQIRETTGWTNQILPKNQHSRYIDWPYY